MWCRVAWLVEPDLKCPISFKAIFLPPASHHLPLPLRLRSSCHVDFQDILWITCTIRYPSSLMSVSGRWQRGGTEGNSGSTRYNRPGVNRSAELLCESKYLRQYNLFGLCVFMYVTYVCIYFGGVACACVYVSCRGQRTMSAVLLYRSLPYFLETRSFTEPGARLTASKL